MNATAAVAAAAVYQFGTVKALLLPSKMCWSRCSRPWQLRCVKGGEKMFLSKIGHFREGTRPPEMFMCVRINYPRSGASRSLIGGLDGYAEVIKW